MASFSQRSRKAFELRKLVTILVTLAAGGTVMGFAAGLSVAGENADNSQCIVQGIGGPTDTDLAAVVDSGAGYNAPAGTTSVPGAASVGGYFNWYFDLAAQHGSTVPDPDITINSGLDPAVFDGGLPTPTFPTSCGFSTIVVGQSVAFSLQAPGTQITFEPGFDSTRTVSPTTVPVGGGDVTITDTVTVTNPDQAGPESSLSVLIPAIPDAPGVTLVSQQDPTNLDHGEIVYHCVVAGCPLPNGVAPATYTLENAQTNTPYTFVTVVHVANPPPDEPGVTPAEWSWLPAVAVNSTPNAMCVIGCTEPKPTGSTQTLTVSSFDGSTPGSGSVTFSVGTTTDSWEVGTQPESRVFYPSSPYPPPAGNGSAASTFGAPTSATTALDTSTSVSDPTNGIRAMLSVPANALPGDDRTVVTTVSLFPVRNPRSLKKALPRGLVYVGAAAASWVTSGGSAPKASAPATMVIRGSHVARGDVVYQFSRKRLHRVKAVISRHAVRIAFDSAPTTFIVAARKSRRHR